MAPRTILYTGKGGVGKTSVAAATARRCAADGLRTLVLSTDPAHSLADALERPLGAEPVQVGERLWAQQVSAQAELERHWGTVRAWLAAALVERGVERITAGELTVPPGLDELFSLLVIRDHHDTGGWDVVVVDCAPTGETLRLLAFPDVARWWLERIFPQQGRLLDVARPLARAVLDIGLPGEAVLDEVGALARGLIALNEILRDREVCSVRLVMTPDRMVIDEARRTFTYLNLYGFLTDAVVVNRVFPEEVGAYFGAWRDRQQEHLRAVEEGFSPVPVLRAPYFDEEVVGEAMLDRLADALFTGAAPAAVLHASLSEELELGRDGATLRLRLPFASREDVGLQKVGSELVVTVDGHRRTLLLPPALSDYRASGARFEDGALHVSFLPPA
ncbi:MAG: ArsA family ATPase [Solirubrobacterales bacterium]|jgi:arsenite-transporting ATPase|nr:ArsA family ATPase [Solirubrobacterales bacterium]